MALFGTSGIRGKYGEKITPELALEVGMALGTYTDGGRIAVATDTRTSGEALKLALISGILSTGASVLEIGCATTPTLALAAKNHADAGAMITASHNPAEYNGIKLWQKSGMSFLPSQEEEIEKIIEKKAYKNAKWPEIKPIERMDAAREHIELIKASVEMKKPLKVVIDCANGPSVYITPYLFREMGCKVMTMNSHPDGFFPGRDPEPNEENLKDLIETVKATKADLGIAHDGDADRAVAVDGNGMIPLDKQLALAAEYCLSKEKGSIVTTVDASRIIEETAKRYKAKVERVKVGDVAVAEGIKKTKALFGGEPCGAWILPKVSLCPDGPLSAAIIAAAASKWDMKKKFSEMGEYFVEREKMPCAEKGKEKIVDAVCKEIKKLKPIGLSKIDGIRAEWKGMWALVRASGTEPIIRITAEGKDKAKLKGLVKKIKALVEKEAGKKC